MHSCVSRIFCHKMWGTAPMTPLKAHYDIHLFEKYDHLLAVSPYKKLIFPGIQEDLSGTSCFQMRHGVMTEYNHPRNIRGRRRRRRVDVEDARRNRRLWIRIM